LGVIDPRAYERPKSDPDPVFDPPLVPLPYEEEPELPPNELPVEPPP